MSTTTELLCSAAVLLVWFAPLALIVWCGLFNGCALLRQLVRDSTRARLPLA